MSVVSAPKAVATSEEKVKISLNSSEMPENNTKAQDQEREGGRAKERIGGGSFYLKAPEHEFSYARENQSAGLLLCARRR